MTRGLLLGSYSGHFKQLKTLPKAAEKYKLQAYVMKGHRKKMQEKGRQMSIWRQWILESGWTEIGR